MGTHMRTFAYTVVFAYTVATILPIPNITQLCRLLSKQQNDKFRVDLHMNHLLY